jgi:Pyruvate/2-oxoacid:ferredoxin oxidoreductase delta subunit
MSQAGGEATLKESGSLWGSLVPRVDLERCRCCADCAAVVACPSGGLRRAKPESVPFTDEGFCLGCYACVDACPHRALDRPASR